MKASNNGHTPLTDKQLRFVEEYLVDLNATGAAVRAGYSKRTAQEQGSRLLSNVMVSKAVAAGRDARSERTGLSQDYVVTRLQKIAERAMQDVPVYDSEGTETGVYTFQGSVANRALELLGKHLGMFTDKVEHSGSVSLEELLTQSLQR
ncbi:MAG: terminase small subunit [Gemmatimonadota bacterium]|nr:terminase small subunit [Gemmatimonadota bacterium]